eukprot:1152177-Pyramimonas_sp.AAC.1
MRTCVAPRGGTQRVRVTLERERGWVVSSPRELRLPVRELRPPLARLVRLSLGAPWVSAAIRMESV